MDSETYLGPLRNGGTVAVIGGGPGGCSVALTLLRLATELGRRYRICLYEPKEFGRHYNQCLGILSPPLMEILRSDFGLKLPAGMILRRITGYLLHGGGESILLEERERDTVAVRRVEFDAWLLDAAAKAGAEVIRSRVTALEPDRNWITVFSEGEHLRADVVFGCFGLDPGLAYELSRRFSYRPPRRIETLVTRYPCSEEVMGRIGDRIVAFLPPIPGVEFASIVPKAGHASVVLAGHRVRVDMLERFLALPEAAQYLPEGFAIDKVYKGAFPCRPARGFFEDRFVTVGDSAGLMRPFKGKGINSAVMTGAIAARTAATVGISKRAFRRFSRECRFITRDYPYGRFVRVLTYALAHSFGLGPLIKYARRNESFRWALGKSVSGGAPYREIVVRCLNPRVSLGILKEFICWPFRNKNKPERDTQK